jgi:hypothetical protein
MALPTSGSLSIKSAAGAGRSISQEVDGNETGNKSLTTLSETAGKTAPHGALEFYGYSSSTAPSVPGNVVAAYDSVGLDIDVTWDAASGTVDNYRIEKSTNGGAYSFLADTGLTLSYSDASVSPGSTYKYRVRAENTTGNSEFVESNSVTVPTE